MTEAAGTSPGERSGRAGGFSLGLLQRGMVTRIGKLELRVPLDREFHCSTELFDRYLRVVQCEVQR